MKKSFIVSVNQLAIKIETYHTIYPSIHLLYVILINIPINLMY